MNDEASQIAAKNAQLADLLDRVEIKARRVNVFRAKAHEHKGGSNARMKWLFRADAMNREVAELRRQAAAIKVELDAAARKRR
jgi:hypothetical protein